MLLLRRHSAGILRVSIGKKRFKVFIHTLSSFDLVMQQTETIRGPYKDHSCQVWSQSSQKLRCHLKQLLTTYKTR